MNYVGDTEISISDASKMFNITRQGLYIAISKNRLYAYKEEGVWRFTFDEYQKYVKSKYSRIFFANKKGENLYDIEKGVISISMASEIFNIPIQRIYYLIRKNAIPFKKYLHHYILNKKDLEGITYRNRKREISIFRCIVKK